MSFALLPRHVIRPSHARAICLVCGYSRQATTATSPARRPPWPIRARTLSPMRHSSSETSPSAAPPTTNASLHQTHYTLFPSTLARGPPPNGPFNIDVRALRREFLRLQSLAHPDVHAGAAKARAEAASARINDAYKTLQSPLRRAEYLLSLRGVDSADEAGKEADMALLSEVLEVREEIDACETEEDVEELRRVNGERIQACVQQLGELFAADDLTAVREAVVRLRYWVSIQESLEQWEKGKPVVLQH